MKGRMKNVFSQGPAVWTIALGVVFGGIGLAASMPHSYVPPKALASFPAPRAVVDSRPLDVPPISLEAIDDQLASLAERVSPSVVTIRVQGTTTNSFGFGDRTGGEGSGVIFRPDGYIVTNDHVAGGMDKVTVTLKDGREFPGKVLRAPEMDIAVVKIDADNLPALPFANSSRVRPGQQAMAIGAPFGLENTVTIGHVSATKRINQIPDPRSGTVRIYWDVIQTDASINMGNSGGPLINVNGEVIGINSAIQSTTGTSSGVGFSISSNQARMLAETLIEKGKVERSFMGVNLEDLREFKAKDLNIPGGAEILSAPNDGPAAMAGLKEGDIVVKVADIDVLSQVDLRNAMLKYAPGDRVTVEFYRGKERRKVDVVLKKAPENTVAVPPRQGREGGSLDEFRRRFEEMIPRGQAPSEEEDVPPVGRPRLGVQMENVTEGNRSQFRLPEAAKGALIISVDPNSPAERAGLQAGDLVVKLGGRTIVDAQSLREAVMGAKAGEALPVEYYRYGADSTLRRSSVTFR